MQVHNPDQNDLKCPTCFQNFATLVDHKNHYKSDFHRYNLKRKMVKLAPITQQQFKAKKGETQAEESDGFKCNECGKKFNSMQTLNQHATSKKHNPNKKVMKQESQQAQVKAPEPYKKNANVCLFCKNEAENFDLNLRHMQGSHSFFVPQQQFCINKKGLIEYLQQKIEVGFLCITCQNKKAKDFATGEAVRKHMTDKGHLFMKTDEGFEEYQKFYDFSKQFEELLEMQKNMNVPGITYTKVKVYANEKNDKDIDGEQEEWEDEDDSGDDDSEQWEDEENEEEEENEMSEKKKKKVITYNIMKPTMTANEELLLPNGKILGHRKYRFLYKQSYRNPFWLDNKLKAIGWNGEAVTNAIISREKMMEIARHDRLLYKTKSRRDKRELRNGMQNNLLMKFFRCQNSL